MSCRRSHRGLAIVYLASAGFAASFANAHPSRIQLDFSGATASLLDLGMDGTYGFSPDSPWYIGGEARRGGLPDRPRQDMILFGGGAGIKGARLAAQVRMRWQQISSVALSHTSYGGTLSYRFLPIGRLDARETHTLRPDERQELTALRRKEFQESISTAPVLRLEFDRLQAAQASSIPGEPGDSDWSATRAGILFTWKFDFPLTLGSAFHFYSNQYSGTDTSATSAFQSALRSRHLRLVRLGPDGPDSGSAGPVEAQQQIHLGWNTPDSSSPVAGSAELAPELAITRIEKSTHTEWSVWLALAHRFGPARRWILTPSYEHLFVEGTPRSMFHFRLGYEFGGGNP